MRHEDLDWDTPLPEKWQIVWRKLVVELIEADAVVFNRGTKPQNAIGRPELIEYWDGSEEACAALIFVRWLVSEEDEDRKWEVNLLMAKARVAPVGGTTAPRAELNGLVVLSRLMDVTVEAMRSKPARITLIGDSECAITATESHTASLSTYFMNRVIEVEDKMREWGVPLKQEKMIETPFEVLMDPNEKTKLLLFLPLLYLLFPHLSWTQQHQALHSHLLLEHLLFSVTLVGERFLPGIPWSHQYGRHADQSFVVCLHLLHDAHPVIPAS